MNKIIINRELCNGCKLCFKSCFVDVIKWDESAKKPVEAYPEDCVQCLYCEINCAQHAIKVVEDYGSYMFPKDNLL